MGGADWAGTMVNRLEREFGTSQQRNTRITTLFRLFASDPRYDRLFDGTDEWNDEFRMVHDDLPDILRDQPGDTIEERWNNFVDERGYQEYAEAGVYLIPWEYFDAAIHEVGVVQERP